MFLRLLLAVLLSVPVSLILAHAAYANLDGEQEAVVTVGQETEGSSSGTAEQESSEAGASAVLITELLPDPEAPQTDAQDEFVEFYNPSDVPQSLAGLALQIGKTRVVLPEVEVPAGGYAVATSGETKLVLGNGGGEVVLLGGDGTELQRVSWPKAKAGMSWSADGENWAWSSGPTPGAENEIVPAESPANKAMEGEAIAEPSAHAGSYPQLRLAELLPDPAAPQTDADDELVELFNPGAEAVDLAGWTIASGARRGVIPGGTIEGGAYFALRSSDVAFQLSNSGSRVALLDPSGREHDATTYPEAEEGQSWSFVSGSWGWSGTATPGSGNVMSAVAGAGAGAVAAKAKTRTARTAAAKRTSAAGKRAASAKRVSAKKSEKKAKAPARTASLASAERPRQANWLLLVALGLTIGYILYEFRHDLRNLYYRARGHASSRRTPGGPS